MKTKSVVIAVLMVSAACLMAGPEQFSLGPAPAPVAPELYRSGEFDISAWGSGAFTKSAAGTDRYFSEKSSFGGGLGGKYFFTKNIGLGLSIEGYNVKNVSTPAFVATSTDARRFIGDVLINGTFRYPIGALAPYVRVGAGTVFNGGNQTLKEPTGTIGKKLKFEVAEHDAKVLAEGAVGVEYRFSPNLGVFTEGAFDKIDRPHSNFFTTRVGITYAF